MRRPFLAALVLLPLLAACDRSDEAGTTVTIGGTNASAGIDAGGRVKIDTPVFRGDFTLPKINLTADNFDIDGVHLYPGSRIQGVDVRAGEGKGDGKGGDDDRVTVRFESPADVATVRGWFADAWRKAGKDVAVDGNALRGTTDDKPFAVELTPAGDGRTAGVVRIG